MDIRIIGCLNLRIGDNRRQKTLNHLGLCGKQLADLTSGSSPKIDDAWTILTHLRIWDLLVWWVLLFFEFSFTTPYRVHFSVHHSGWLTGWLIVGHTRG